MEQSSINKQFACRLKDAMLASGFHSKRSNSGVCIHKLVEITGYSIQICRRYLRGESIPELIKIIAIAESLHVSPGWLLFGGVSTENNPNALNREILNYFFSKINKLYDGEESCAEMPIFLTDIIVDLSQIHATDEQLKKIVDLALTSVKYFYNKHLHTEHQ